MVRRPLVFGADNILPMTPSPDTSKSWKSISIAATSCAVGMSSLDVSSLGGTAKLAPPSKSLPKLLPPLPPAARESSPQHDTNENEPLAPTKLPSQPLRNEPPLPPPLALLQPTPPSMWSLMVTTSLALTTCARLYNSCTERLSARSSAVGARPCTCSNSVSHSSNRRLSFLYSRAMCRRPSRLRSERGAVCTGRLLTLRAPTPLAGYRHMQKSRKVATSAIAYEAYEGNAKTHTRKRSDPKLVPTVWLQVGYAVGALRATC